MLPAEKKNKNKIKFILDKKGEKRAEAEKKNSPWSRILEFIWFQHSNASKPSTLAPEYLQPV